MAPSAQTSTRMIISTVPMSLRRRGGSAPCLAVSAIGCAPMKLNPEHILQKLNDFCHESMLQPIESRPPSSRVDDSVRADRAPGCGTGHLVPLRAIWRLYIARAACAEARSGRREAEARG